MRVDERTKLTINRRLIDGGPPGGMAPYNARSLDVTLGTTRDSAHGRAHTLPETLLMQRLCLAIAILLTFAAAADSLRADDEFGFRPLFDGQTLNGWRGEERFWRVENGAIVGESTPENPLDHNTFLVWDHGEVDDFELRLQFKLTAENEAEANSGIQFRSQIEPDGHVVGYQADIDLAGKWIGAIYDEHGRGLLAGRHESVDIGEDGQRESEEYANPPDATQLIRPGEWNDYAILAEGGRIQLRINGHATGRVSDYEKGEHDLAGVLALQLHSGPPQRIEFRNIRLKRLPLADKKKVVFVAGKPSHGAGQHEHNAGCRLLAMLLNRSREAHGTPVIATVYQNGWPKDPTAFDNADTVVSYCDGGQGHYLNQHLEDFDDLVKERGVGLVCIHYAVETTAGDCGDHFLNWIGGFFEPHWSVNPHWTPNFKTLPDHPITRGVSPFEINDEWYYHMRFRPEMANVTPILTDLPTSETLTRPDGPHSGNPAVREAVLVRKEPQHVAWAYERPDGKGRGFGFTGGHFHRNWADDNFRTIVTNAILWTAGAEVPDTGVPTDTPTADEMAANLDPKTAEKKPAPKPTAPPPVAESRNAADALSQLDVHPDLTATLFAAEPLLLNPTDIDIDHRGRVWVCEVINYRRFANGDKPERSEGDRILILEDTDADGRADKTTTFYQGRDVDSAHGICVLGTPDDKGTRAIISCGPEVFFLIDDDGDLHADRKEVLFTGIEGMQHDHGIHAFVFGPDGKLYFNFGNAGVRIKDKHGQPIVDKAGNVVAADRQPYQEGMVFRCDLDGSEFETLAWNFRNNWEVAVDSFGGLWQSDNDDDGNRGVRINFVMEYGNYGYKDEITGAGWQTPRTGWEDDIPLRHFHQADPGVVPNLLQTGAGSPTGICVYEGDALPAIFRGALIHTDAGPNICRAYVTKPQGAGYTAEIVNILDGAARDKWFRPSDVCVAPDGSLLIADWYDPGVGGHRMGDVEHGRIFRVAAKRPSDASSFNGEPSATAYEAPQFDFSTPDGAVAALQSPNLSTRYVAYTALQNMGAAAEPALTTLSKSENPRLRARALWLLCKLGLPQDKVRTRLKHAVGDPNVDIRCAAIRIARQLPDITTPVLEEVFNRQESSSAVQREYLIALRESQDPRFAQAWAILAAFGNDQDRWFLEALGIAADGRWDEVLQVAAPYFDQLAADKVRNLVWRSRGQRTAALLTKLIADEKTPAAELPRLFRAFDFQPDSPEKTNSLTTLAFTPPARDDQTHFIQAEALQRLPGFDINAKPEYLAALNTVLDAGGDSEQFIRLVGKFSVSDRYDDLLALARRHANEQLAIEAVRTLLDKDQLALIRDAIHSTDPVVADETLTALSTAADARTLELLLATVADAEQSQNTRRAAVRALGSIRAGAQALARLAESGSYDPLVKEALAATLHTVKWQDIKEQALALFPLPPGRDSEPVPPLAELLGRTGDIVQGRIAFHSTGTCAKCHVVNGIGLNIGPELSEIGKKLSKQALYESILYPSAAISHNYETWAVLDTSGNITTGLLVSETPTELQIKDEKALVRTIAVADIEERRKLDISMMPADMQKILSVQELVDIVEFMTTLQQAQK